MNNFSCSCTTLLTDRTAFYVNVLMKLFFFFFFATAYHFLRHISATSPSLCHCLFRIAMVYAHIIYFISHNNKKLILLQHLTSIMPISLPLTHKKKSASPPLTDNSVISSLHRCQIPHFLSAHVLSPSPSYPHKHVCFANLNVSWLSHAIWFSTLYYRISWRITNF